MVSSVASSPFPSLETALKHFFGYDQFRLHQRAAIEAVLAQQDALVVMPTGGGKSLCYQLPALLRIGVTVVVSPLIALMQDQVDALVNNGIAATYLNSSLDGMTVRSRQADILAGRTKLLYLSPERLLSENFWPFLNQLHQQVGIAGFAIDEAHCVSEWGHDFRPEYRQLHRLRTAFPSVSVLALTATATERVRHDIVQQLQLRDPAILVASFNRPNLYYEVRPKARQPYGDLLAQVQALQGSGIIYCLSRKRVDEVAARLQQDGVAALPYHAGLPDGTRTEHQHRFIRDDVRIMVATVAFGMGINKPDVRLVVHYDLPRTLEGYYQESGRSGRDGEPAHCTVYFSYADVSTINYLIEQKPDAQEQNIARQQLRQVIDYAESSVCRRQIQLAYFGETLTAGCDHCDNCRHPRPQEDWTLEAQKFLSCVARCRERFGMGHIIDVLRGSRKKRIRDLGHDQLSTYGIGQDRSAEEWKLLGRSLLHQGLVEETTDGFPVLKLNAASWQVLRKQLTVQVAIPDTLSGGESLADAPASADQSTLLGQLKSLRKRLADGQGIPPYMVFTETSLRQMTQKLPRTQQAFSQISGVGNRKLEQYGQAFIGLIEAFCTERGLSAPGPQATAAPSAATPAATAPGNTHDITLDLYRQGHRPEAIAELRNLKPSTIVRHLIELIDAGVEVDINPIIATAEQEQIWAAIAQVESGRLGEIHTHLQGTYTYDQIRLVRSAYRLRGD
ncbi:MAG: DNA helicase RecQ [Cyanobacteria bacterium]|nr:DNA helicase RecQ [Cyanobacteriota bacterium]